jgi:hypothetical protein
VGTDVVLARTCCRVGVGGCSFGRLCCRVGGCSFGRAGRASGKLKIQLKIPTDILVFVLILILFFNLNYVKFWPLYPSRGHANGLAIGLGPHGQVTVHWTVTWPWGANSVAKPLACSRLGHRAGPHGQVTVQWTVTWPQGPSPVATPLVRSRTLRPVCNDQAS